MHYPDVLAVCLNAGLKFLEREPLALLMEAPIRLAMQTACLKAAPVVELEVGYREKYGSEFVHLHHEGEQLSSREGEPTNNVFAANSRETCDIRVTVNGSHYGFAFELKCAGEFGSNKKFRYKNWDAKDLWRLFHQGLSRRGESLDSMVEGAILAASRNRYEEVRRDARGLLVDFESLPVMSLGVFSVYYHGQECWLVGGKCTAFGEERAMVCITRLSYLDEPWPAPPEGWRPKWTCAPSLLGAKSDAAPEPALVVEL